MIGSGSLLLGALALALASPPAERIDPLLDAYHALGQLEGAVLVAEHGRIVTERAFGQAHREWEIPNTPDTAFRIASLTKQFTAALVLKLAEQGQLRLDDTVGAWVPGLRKDIADRVTLHHLLSHTSGIVDYVNVPGFWANRMGERVSRDDILAIMNRDLEFAPGSQGKYDSSGYYLLGLVVEKAAGRPYEAALEAMILRPLGMTRTGYDAPERVVPRKASGYTRSMTGDVRPADPFYIPNVAAGGGMYSTVGDLYRWDRALAGTALLSAESKARMFTAYAPDDVRRDLGFGYGWLVGTRRIGGRDRVVHEHGGNANGFRTLITRYPEDGTLIVILMNEGSGNIAPAIYGMRAEITNALYGLPVTFPRRPLGESLAREFAARGVAAAMADLVRVREAAAPAEDAGELNQMGYESLMAGRADEALALFQLNARLFPEDWNVHDSLGEALLAGGDTAAALAAYRRSVELNPRNTNGLEILRKLEAR